MTRLLTSLWRNKTFSINYFFKCLIANKTEKITPDGLKRKLFFKCVEEGREEYTLVLHGVVRSVKSVKFKF